MIFARIKKWIPVADIEHTSTDWTLYLDKEKTQVLEYHPKSDMLEVFISPIEIPKDQTYYLQPVMHFNRDDIEYPLDAIPVSNLKQSISNMLLKEEPYIERPYMYLNKEDLFNGLPDLKLRSSKFRSNIDLWKSTSYFILSPNDDILYSILDEEEHKEEVTIPNLDKFKAYSYLKLGIIHKGLTGVESMLNITKLELFQDVDYTVATNLYNVQIQEDLEVVLKPLKTGDNLRINKVELCDKSTNKPIILLEQVKDNTFFIPKDYLKSGFKYKVAVTKASVSGKDNVTYYHDLEVAIGTFDLIKSEAYKYDGVLQSYDGLDEVRVPDNTITEAMYNGIIYIPNKTTKLLDAYIVEKNENNLPRLVSKKTTAQGINLLNEDVSGTCFRILEKNLIVIDTLNEQNKPTFLIYEFSISAQTFTLKASKTRADETKCLGYTGSIVRINKEEFIYNPIGTNRIVKYNFIKNVLVELPGIPLPTVNYGIFIRNKNNRMFIGNNVDFNACVFNYVALEYTEGYVFGPQHFVNKENAVVPLINGNSLIINKDLTPDKKDVGVVEYNFARGTFNEIHKTEFKLVRPYSFVICQYGEILMYGHEPELPELAPDYSGYTVWVYK